MARSDRDDLVHSFYQKIEKVKRSLIRADKLYHISTIVSNLEVAQSRFKTAST